MPRHDDPIDLSNLKCCARRGDRSLGDEIAGAIGLVHALQVYAATGSEIDSLFARLDADKRAQALLVTNDPFYVAQRVQLATLAARYAVPTIYPFREMAESGGLLSYGPNIVERDRQAGLYVGRVLKGERPGEMPVMRASKFELVVNLATAKTLSLEVPPTLLARADGVIE